LSEQTLLQACACKLFSTVLKTQRNFLHAARKLVVGKEKTEWQSTALHRPKTSGEPLGSPLLLGYQLLGSRRQVMLLM
jgi:hypothetical protein